MANEENQGNSMADKAVDKVQEKSGNQNSKVDQAVDKAQEKGFVKKAQDKAKEQFGKGGGKGN